MSRLVSRPATPVTRLGEPNTIAANKARDWLRSRNRKREVPLDLPTDGEEEREARHAGGEGQHVDRGLCTGGQTAGSPFARALAQDP